MDEGNHVTTAQVLTYAVGALQIIGGFLFAGIRKDIADVRKTQAEEQTRLNLTREQMLLRAEFKADVTAILEQIQTNAKEGSAAREALQTEVQKLQLQHANATASNVHLERAVTELNRRLDNMREGGR
jgi:hypothetical protein